MAFYRYALIDMYLIITFDMFRAVCHWQREMKMFSFKKQHFLQRF